MKNRSQRHDINRPRSRYGHKYTEYKMCLSIMMVICIKQHLSNIWSSIHKKVKKHWDWGKKKRCLLPLFILGKLGTIKIDCGEKISKKPSLFAFSSGK